MLLIYRDSYMYVLGFCLLLVCVKIYFLTRAEWISGDLRHGGGQKIKFSGEEAFRWDFKKAKEEAIAVREEEASKNKPCFFSKKPGRLEMGLVVFAHFLKGCLDWGYVTVQEKHNLPIGEQEKLYESFCKYANKFRNINRILWPMGMYLCLPAVMHITEFLSGVNFFGGIAEIWSPILPFAFVAGLFLAGSMVLSGFQIVQKHDQCEKDQLKEMIDRNRKLEKLGK